MPSRPESRSRKVFLEWILGVVVASAAAGGGLSACGEDSVVIPNSDDGGGATPIADAASSGEDDADPNVEPTDGAVVELDAAPENDASPADAGTDGSTLDGAVTDASLDGSTDGAVLDAGPDAADSGPKCQNGTTSVIATNHAGMAHVLVVAQVDVTAGVTKAFDISGAADHTHSVTITSGLFGELKAEGSISVGTTMTNGHTHNVTVSCN